MSIQIGDKLPDFCTVDEESSVLTSEDLLGNITILYFCSKKDSPEMVEELCGFRDAISEFKEREVAVFGVTRDTPENNKSFCFSYNLDFPFLSDPSCEIADFFGVAEYAGDHVVGIQSATVIIDEEGIIRWKECPIQESGHLDRVVQALDRLQP